METTPLTYYVYIFVAPSGAQSMWWDTTYGGTARLFVEPGKSYDIDVDGSNVTIIDNQTGTVYESEAVRADTVVGLAELRMVRTVTYDKDTTRFFYPDTLETHPDSLRQPDSKTTAFTWTAGGEILTRQGPDGVWSVVERDVNGRVSAIYTAASGDTERTEFLVYTDTSIFVDTLLIRISPADDSTFFFFDDNDRVIDTYVRQGASTLGRVQYAFDGLSTILTNANGDTSRYYYSESNTANPRAYRRLMHIKGPGCECDGGGESVSYAYDSLGNRRLVVDGLGVASEYIYDSRSRLIRQKDGGEHITSGSEGGITADSVANAQRIVEYFHSSSHYWLDSTRTYSAIDPDSFTYTVYSHYTTNGELDSVKVKTIGFVNETTRDTAQVSYRFNSLHLDSLVDGPRTDVSDTTKYFYDGWNLDHTVDAVSCTTWYDYDSADRLIRQVGSNRDTTELIYDSFGRLTKTVRVGTTGDTTLYWYSPGGRLDSLRTPGGRKTHYSYNAAGWQIAMWNDARDSLVYRYDGVGNRIAELTYGAGTLVQRTWYEYDDYNRLSRVLPDSNTSWATMYSYYSNGRLEKLVQPDSTWTLYEYDRLGQLTGSVSERITPFGPRDPNGRMIAIWHMDDDSNGAVEANGDFSLSESATNPTYGLSGEINNAIGYQSTGDYLYTTTYGLQKPDSLSMSLWYKPSSADFSNAHYIFSSGLYPYGVRLLMDSGDLKVLFGHGSGDHRATSSMSLTAGTWYFVSAEFKRIYDGPIGDSVIVTISVADDNDSTATVDSNETSIFVYDYQGQIAYDDTIFVVGANADYSNGISGSVDEVIFRPAPFDIEGYWFYKTSYEYDYASRQAAVINAEEEVTTFTYDDFGNLRELRTPDAGTVRMSYDEAGNMTQRITARGDTLQYSYDALNRTTRQVARDDGLVNDSTLYSYDRYSTSGADSSWGRGQAYQISRFGDLPDTLTYLYDRVGRTRQFRLNVDTLSFPLSYVYDKDDNATAITYPDSSVLRYRYDKGYVDSVWQTGASNVTFLKDATYRPFGLPTYLLWNNGRREDRSYNSRGLLSDISWRTSSGPIAYTFRNAFEYDARGNPIARASLTDIDGTCADTTGYEYDALGRLTGGLEWVYNTEGDSSWRDTTWVEGYGYDRIGNRLDLDTWTDTSHYVYEPGTSRIDSTYDGGVVQYTHDADGNETLRGVTFDWSERDEMVKRTDPVGIQTYWYYRYDGLGRRVRKHTSSLALKTYFLYDLSGRLVYEMVFDSTQRDKVRERRNYYYLGDRPFGIRESGAAVTTGHYWLVTDHLNTPWKTLSSTGTASWSGTYYPFGNLRTESGTTRLGNLRFPGQYHDRESSLYYNVFRYYRSGDGRYTSVDPVLDPTSSTYSYAWQMPTRLYDPLGLAGWWWLPDWIECLYRFGRLATYITECRELAEEQMPCPEEVVCEGINVAGEWLRDMVDCINERAGDPEYFWTAFDVCGGTFAPFGLMFPGAPSETVKQCLNAIR